MSIHCSDYSTGNDTIFLYIVHFSADAEIHIFLNAAPALEIIEVSIYFLKTIFIDCSVSLGIIKKLLSYVNQLFFCHAAVPVRIQPVPVSIPVKPSCFQLSVLIKNTSRRRLP